MIRRTFLALTAATALSMPAYAQDMDIVDTAAAAGSFTTLLAAAEAAGLVETLKGEGPLTVFAPTDDAFAALPEGTVESLLLPENQEQLTSILLYHVVPGKVMSTDLSDGMEATTAGEQTLMVDLSDGVKIGEATVVTPDIEASNGVIHVIDSVLLPAS
ncbi:MAG: fasciclin domain-containing protein [Jannaschia sp.]